MFLGMYIFHRYNLSLVSLTLILFHSNVLKTCLGGSDLVHNPPLETCIIGISDYVCQFLVELHYCNNIDSALTLRLQIKSSNFKKSLKKNHYPTCIYCFKYSVSRNFSQKKQSPTSSFNIHQN